MDEKIRPRASYARNFLAVFVVNIIVEVVQQRARIHRVVVIPVLEDG